MSNEFCHVMAHIVCDTDQSISILFVLLSVMFVVKLGVVLNVYVISSDVVQNRRKNKVHNYEPRP